MMDEKELIKRAKDGDLKAYEDIIGIYEKKVFSIIYHMVRNESEVEDIAQEVFIKIYRNLPKFKEQSSLYTWIYRITVNVCIDEMKKRKNVIYINDNIKTDDGEIEIQIKDEGKTLEEIVNDKEYKRELFNCIKKLPERQRIMIVLRDIKGFTYMEIAEILKMNLGTVKSQINRARASLKEILIENETFIENCKSI